VLLNSRIRANLDAVRDRLARAARRAGRDPSAVRLVAVSKTFDADHVRAAAAAGQVEFGENRVQEALEKIAQTSDIPVRWHLVGHLQANKVRKAATAFAVIHSVDSLDLLERLDRAAVELATAPEVLVQVDLAGETTKFGAPPEAARQVAEAASRARAVRLAGLMVLPPLFDDPELARSYFVRLRRFRDELIAAGLPSGQLRELSMGMSHDFEIAIEEGATIVRIGTAVFGARLPRIESGG